MTNDFDYTAFKLHKNGNENKKKKENERGREVRNSLSTLNRKAVTTVLKQSNKETFPQKNREALTSIEHHFSRTFFYTKVLKFTKAVTNVKQKNRTLVSNFDLESLNYSQCFADSAN